MFILTRPIKSNREFTDWISDLFDELRIESAHMVGNSFGGFLALQTALYLPERVVQKAYAWMWQGFPADECVAKLRAITSTAGFPRHPAPSVFSDEELRRNRTPVLLLIGDHEVVYEPERVREALGRPQP